MFKELINSLSFMYTFAARSRGKLDRQELEALQGGAHVMATNASAVLADKETDFTRDEKNDMAEAQLISMVMTGRSSPRAMLVQVRVTARTSSSANSLDRCFIVLPPSMNCLLQAFPRL